MVRESLDANAKNVLVFLTPTNGARVQWRSTTGGSEADDPGVSSAQPNHWLRLIRRGNAFAGLGSSDGQHWVALGSQTVSMGTNVYIGIGQATANYSNTDSNSATYDNYSIQSSTLPSPWLEQNTSSVSTPNLSTFDDNSYIIHTTGQDT